MNPNAAHAPAEPCTPTRAGQIAAWLAALGLTCDGALSRLRQHAGVTTWRFTAGKQPFYLKEYPVVTGLKRCPYQLEKRFYELAASGQGSFLLRPLGWNEALRICCLPAPKPAGRGPQAMGIPGIAASMAMLTTLSRARLQAAGQGWPIATGARFSLEQHLAYLARLLARLEKNTRANRELAALIADEFEPAWQILQVAVARQCARFQWPAHRVLALAERCLSPGGWALRHPTANADGSLVFTDFEEAGWDDPAWVCASLFHPGGPAPFNYFRTFAGNLARSLGQGEGMVQRALVLMPLARLQQVLEANLEQANPPHNTRKLAAEFRRAWRDIAQMEVWQ